MILPKLFRRQVAYQTKHRAKLLTGGFSAYLKEQKDACFLTKERLEQGRTVAVPHFLDEFVDGSVFTRRGEELVFQEADSRIVGRDGREVTAWWS